MHSIGTINVFDVLVNYGNPLFAIKKKYFTVEFSFLIPPFNIFIVQVSRFDCHMGIYIFYK